MTDVSQRKVPAMRLPRHTIAIAATLALLGVGVASAAPAPQATQSQMAARQRFLLLDDDGNPNRAAVVANGAIHALGHDVVLGPRRDRFVFDNGSVVIRHRPTDSHDSYDEETCHFSFVEVGTWRVVRATGAYVGATGHGHYRVTGQGINCNPRRAPSLFLLKIVARGQLTG